MGTDENVDSIDVMRGNMNMDVTLKPWLYGCTELYVEIWVDLVSV